MFCPKCSSLLMPKEVAGKKVLGCTSCDYIQDKGGTLREKSKVQEKELEVVEEGQDKTSVEIDAECPKCGHGRAEYWEVQTRAADEPPTRFHKCVKCGHTWREYS